MMNHKTLNCLATKDETRNVNLLQNHQVALNWDKFTITMRMADLITLHNVLRTYMEDCNRAWAKTYVVSLNERRLFLHNEDLYHFCALIQEAAEQLPRRTVRWIDFAVTITPLDIKATTVGCFTVN